MDETFNVITLRSNSLELEVIPWLGGSVGSFRAFGRDLFRPISDSDRQSQNVLGVSMFPMFPYANRITNNEFIFEKVSYKFRANNLPERYNVHGCSWKRVWSIGDTSERCANIFVEVTEHDQPYAYRAEQHFELDENSLIVNLSIKNQKSRAMPFGFGLHPWFQKSEDVTIKFDAKSFYLEEPDGVSGDIIVLPPELDFSTPKHLPIGWRNNNYGNWDGSAEIIRHQERLKMNIEADSVFKNLMFYSDPKVLYFCLEPQTNASGAFNRDNGFSDKDQGIIILEPNEKIEGKIRFTPTINLALKET